MATLENIQAKIASLQTEAEAIVKKQSLAAIAKISDLMQKHGLTFADLEAQLGGRGRGRKPVGAKVTGNPVGEAKYVDPKTGVTWTGHGRAPAWIVNAKDRSRFLIDGSVQHLLKNARSLVKVGNYVRGPQEPKYWHPETGATWSGRGRAPAWLADVKDRTTFLIERKGDAVPKAVTTKTVVAKKATAKKAVSNEATAKKRVAPAKKSPLKKPARRNAATK